MDRIDPTETEPSRFEPSMDRIKRIAEAPYANLRLSGWWIRKTFFTRPRSNTDLLRVPLAKPELRELFGHNYFEPGWETSYQFRNEIFNVRRVEYDAEEHPPLDWWQVHIRGYPLPPEQGEAAHQLELTAHYEPEPVEHPDAHISKEYIDSTRGMEAMRQILDDNDVEYDYVEYRVD